MEAEYLQGQLITEGNQGWLGRDLEYGLHQRACKAAITIYEQWHSNAPKILAPARAARGSSPFSDDSSNTTRHNSSRSLLEKGIKKIFRRRIRGQLCFPRLSASGRSAGICCIYHTSSLDIARRSFGCGFPARARGVALSASGARQLCCPCVIDSCVHYESPRGG